MMKLQGNMLIEKSQRKANTIRFHLHVKSNKQTKTNLKIQNRLVIVRGGEGK